MAIKKPTIPETIVVHLGMPENKNAPNLTVSFPDYIKNVASSEIYPTWPESAIRANIYAQVSYALNRVYTEWYRSKGYDFDITNSTRYDQAFVRGRDIFENIGRIVDEQFNDYVVRGDNVEPMFTQYCNGTTVTCAGMSQWGTVPLAEQGKAPYEILQHFYGDDINLVFDAPVVPAIPSYPGKPLQRGSTGPEVRDLQVRLNRISTNYPGIPKIYPVDGIFDIGTEEAVRTFQKLFNLAQDGIVGQATWYRVMYLYTSVKRLAELDSEGISLEEASHQYPSQLAEGSTGIGVRLLQYYLSVLAQFYPSIPAPPIDGTFGKETTASVRAFQLWDGLAVDGIVGRQTWYALYDAYRAIVSAVPQGTTQAGIPLFPGTPLVRGESGENVTRMQEALNYIAGTYPEIGTFPVTGYYGDQTAQAVRSFQELFGLDADGAIGAIGAITWDTIASVYADLQSGTQVAPGQYPGYILREEETK